MIKLVQKFIQLPDTHPFDGISLFVTFLTEVCIVPLQKLTLDKLKIGKKKIIMTNRVVQTTFEGISLLSKRVNGLIYIGFHKLS